MKNVLRDFNTNFVSAREAFNLIYGYDPMNEYYEMETIEECEVEFPTLETATA